MALAGSGSDSDGNITSYHWTQIAGPSVELETPDSSTPSFQTPFTETEQTLTFSLTVTDNQGATATDTVDIQVIPSSDLTQLQFDDPNLKECLYFQAKDNGWARAAQVQTLNCSSEHLIAVGGMAQLYRLEQLDLSNNYLTTLSELTNMPNLHTLNIAGNPVRQAELDLLFTKHNWQSLDLSSIEYSHLAFSAEMSQLKQLFLNEDVVSDLTPLNTLPALEELELSKAKVETPQMLAQIPSLKAIDARFIDSKAAIDTILSVKTWQRLAIFDFGTQDISTLQGMNQLEDLEIVNVGQSDLAPLGNLTNLRKLKIVNDFLPGEVTTVLGKLSLLEELDCRIGGTPDLTPLTQLDHLKHLNLHFQSTPVGSALPDFSALGEIQSLESLEVSATIGQSISALTQLNHLRSLNMTTDSTIDLSFVSSIENLEELTLSQKTSQAQLVQLSQATQLKSLKFWSSESPLDATPLKNLTQLTKLDIYADTLTDDSWLQQLGNLQTLKLWLSTGSLDLGRLSGLTHLETLKLQSGGTKMLYNLNAMGHLEQLKSIDIEGGTDDLNFSELPAQPNLRRLDVKMKSPGRQTDLEFAGGTPELRHLSLLNSDTSGFNGLTNLAHLSELELCTSSNDTHTADYTPLNQLKVPSYVSLCDFAGANELTHLSNIRKFEIARLDNSSLDKDIFPDLNSSPLLRQLYIYGVQPQSFDFLAQSQNLQKVIIFGQTGINDITPLSTMDDLWYVHIDGSGNEQVQTNLDILADKKNLKFLILRGIGITDISPISDLPRLDYLGLSFNKLETLPTELNWPNLRELWLSSNPLKDVEPLFQLTQLKRLDLMGSNNIPCSQIDQLSGIFYPSVLNLPYTCAP